MFWQGFSLKVAAAIAAAAVARTPPIRGRGGRRQGNFIDTWGKTFIVL